MGVGPRASVDWKQLLISVVQLDRWWLDSIGSTVTLTVILQLV
ncbi:hypothetical protein GBAR_LOCUS14365 [Geodia barretti]|uniref:Uncharacterized protein n=1 Tax=Geodia barretti TaxID=519541 RepID=A0AA35WKH2_GEOBA|nr:hypothetical protein GBAR_LOCUS14365 [Geodia barretti]